MKDVILIITIRNLNMEYSDFTLTIPELNLETGKIYGLVGQNGAGKTTLIQCLLGLLLFEGQISYDGQTMEEHRMELLPKIAYVSDRLFYSHEMTGAQVQRFTSRYYPHWDEDLFINLSRELGINLNKKLKKLSQGTKTKLAIAMAIAKQPDIYILDEPTSGLDPIVRGEILKELKKASAERDTIVLFSTHILEDIIEIVDNVITIKNGRVNDKFDVINRENPQELIASILQSIQ